MSAEDEEKERSVVWFVFVVSAVSVVYVASAVSVV